MQWIHLDVFKRGELLPCHAPQLAVCTDEFETAMLQQAALHLTQRRQGCRQQACAASPLKNC